jgi:hypothetical protein
MLCARLVLLRRPGVLGGMPQALLSLVNQLVSQPTDQAGERGGDSADSDRPIKPGYVVGTNQS